MKRPTALARSLPFALVACLPLAACDEPQDEYLEIKGGGFVFNYRIAEARYGFVAEALRDLPDGSLVVASFEDPGGGEPIRIEQRPYPGQHRFVFDTPPLYGVEAKRPYRASLEVVREADRHVVETHERTYASSVSQEVLPKAPLTIGPGYARNPDLHGE